MTINENLQSQHLPLNFESTDFLSPSLDYISTLSPLNEISWASRPFLAPSGALYRSPHSDITSFEPPAFTVFTFNKVPIRRFLVLPILFEHGRPSQLNFTMSLATGLVQFLTRL